MKKTFYVKTLGCKVNSYESEFIKSLFLMNGYSEEKDASVFIVNTCTVTNNADNKSKKVIKNIKKSYPNSILIVVGCFAQYLMDNNNINIDADIIIGNKDKSKIIEYLNKFINEKKQIIVSYNMNKQEFENMEISNYSSHVRANIKIEDGCNNFCSYCIIPYVRGRVRSKKKELVIEEVNKLVNNGYKEIILTGIHTGQYNDEETDLYGLLCELIKIENLKRIRISSIEIVELNDNIISLLKKTDKLMPHFHIPLQSGCDKTLKSMNRRYDTKYFIDRVKLIRKINKEISLTTDVIVGFNDETDEDFNNTYEFIRKIKFSKIHVFPYSERIGTKASNISNPVPNLIKKQRAHKLLELSSCLESEYAYKCIGRTFKVLIESKNNNYYYGYTENYIMVKLIGNYEINNIYEIVLEMDMICES